MDVDVVTPWKIRKLVNYKLCLICQLNSKGKPVAKKPNAASVEKLINACNERNNHNDFSVNELAERLSPLTTEEILQNNGTYHYQCYKEITNVKTINQVKDRFAAAMKEAIVCYCKSQTRETVKYRKY